MALLREDKCQQLETACVGHYNIQNDPQGWPSRKVIMGPINMTLILTRVHLT